MVDGRPPHQLRFVSIRQVFSRLLLAAALVAAPLGARAQQKPADPAKQLKSLQEQLDLTRKQRLELEARLEKELAAEIAQRAQMLAMGGEVGALQRLEQLLDSAQMRLLVQRDRIHLLRDDAQAADKAVIVVLVRADKLASDAAVALTIDGAPGKSAAISADQSKALAGGAAEELYRGEISPGEHKVALQFTGKGLNAAETVTVTATPSFSCSTPC